MSDRLEIFRVIARRPHISDVELCDALNIEIGEVHRSIDPFVERGQIIAIESKAPTWNTTYHFSEEYKTHKAYQLMLVDGPDNQIAPGPVANNSAGPSTVKKLTKLELALNYIAVHGKVSTAELKLAMEITASPICYLSGAINNNQIARDGKYWVLGTSSLRANNVAPRVPQKSAFPQVVAASVAEPEPEEDSESEEEQQPDVSTDNQNSAFVCALWSDGEFAMIRDGEQIAVLSRVETAAVRRYFGLFDPSVQMETIPA